MALSLKQAMTRTMAINKPRIELTKLNTAARLLISETKEKVNPKAFGNQFKNFFKRNPYIIQQVEHAIPPIKENIGINL